MSICRKYTNLARALVADTLLAQYRTKDFQQLGQPFALLQVRNRIWRLETFNALPNIKLIIVDLRLTDAKTAIRFMGEDGYNHRMDHHQLQPTA